MRFDEFSLICKDNSELLKLFHSTVPSGKRVFREHHHTEFEIALILSGSGIYTVVGKEYSFSKGDIFLFNSNEIHCITQIDDCEPLDTVTLYIEPRYVWSKEGLANPRLLNVFLGRSEDFENRINSENPRTAELRSLLYKTEKEFKEKNTEYTDMIKAYITMLLVALLRDYGFVDENAVNTSYMNTVNAMNEVIKYIDANIEKKLTLEELALVGTMNKTYFSTVFKKYNGITPWEYVTIKRVELAVQLLKGSNMTVLEISEKCGFSSSSNFYKAFTRVTGHSPGYYKIKHND